MTDEQATLFEAETKVYAALATLFEAETKLYAALATFNARFKTFTKDVQEAFTKAYRTGRQEAIKEAQAASVVAGQDYQGPLV